MKHTKLKVTALVALGILGAIVSAQETKLKKSDLPAAVQKTAGEQSQGATVKGYASEKEGGKLLYEVEMTVNGHSKDVTIAADGSIVEVEEETALNALPDAVQEALKRKAGAGKITKVESLTKHNTLVAYEAQVLTGAKRSEIQVAPDGKDLAHPE